MPVLDAPDVVTVDSHAGPLRVRNTGGSGSPVLRVHSLLVDGDLYHRLLVDALDGLGIEAANVVGVDTGGALTQLLMAHHRERVGRVVLTACDAFPPRSIGWAVPLLKVPGVLAPTARLLQTRVGRQLLTTRPVTHAGTDDVMLRGWAQPLLDPDVRRDLASVLDSMSPTYTLAAAEANRDSPRPVLIAWGDDAHILPRRLAEALVRDMPDARLVTLTDFAVLAALDAPDQLVELIDAHLS